jgi:adenylate kinase family enzyme
MQRIAILGAGGAGKTVLARQLGQLLGLPVTHLDQLRYDPDWNLVPEATFTAAQRRMVAGDAWIIDGNSQAYRRRLRPHLTRVREVRPFLSAAAPTQSAGRCASTAHKPN